VQTVLREVGADRVPAIEVFNKCDQLDAGERARLSAVRHGALCVSARDGDGRDEVIAAIESRLGLDTADVRFEFSAADAAGRESIAQLYRVGRVLSHVATDGRVTIEAQLPRRLLERFRKEHAGAAAIR